MSADTYSESGSGGSGSGPRPSSLKARQRQQQGRQFLSVRSTALTPWTPWRRSRRIVSDWDAQALAADREASLTNVDDLQEPEEGFDVIFAALEDCR